MAKKHRVLVIDDEAEILNIVSFMLESEEFEIVLAQNGEAALVELSRASFDLVICDFLMPSMDGISLLTMVGLGAYFILAKSDIAKLIEVVKKAIKQNETLKMIDEDFSDESNDFLKLVHSSFRLNL
jgi:DNA-binding NtrC family response regulator